MVVIRLTRRGAKKRPFYHVVAADSRKPRDGAFLERLGYFNPLTQEPRLRSQLLLDRVEFWVRRGAQLSDRVKSLVREVKRSAQPTV